MAIRFHIFSTTKRFSLIRTQVWGWLWVLTVSSIFNVTLLNGVEGTLTVISEGTNETVFSAEEAGIDSASAYELKGHLLIASPLDACTTLDPPPPLSLNGSQTHSWILLATVHLKENEDSCSLARKAKNAQAAGYAGIILRRIGANNTDGVIPKFIGLDWVGVRIYACVVGDDIGVFLMEKYVYPKQYFVRFDNEPYYPIGLLTNFIIIFFLGIITVLLLLRLFHYLYFSVTTRVVERRRRRKTLLSESQLRKLPILTWTSSIPQDTCSICIEQFETEDEVRVLPCSHVFHKLCIDPWLLKESRKCPNCKGRVLFPNERGRYTYSSDSEEAESGDERTPLLRPRENYRFIETLTESHNNRALHDQYQYLQDTEDQDHPQQGSESETLSPSGARRSIPKVTFAPAISVFSSSSSNSSSNTSTTRPVSKAFVLPMAAKPLKSPLKKANPHRTTNKTNATAGTSTNTGPDHDTTTVQQLPRNELHSQTETDFETASKLSSSSSSDGTLIDFYDIPDPDSNHSFLTNSTDSRTQSFHSCAEFESEYPSLEGGAYGSFQSFSSGNSS